MKKIAWIFLLLLVGLALFGQKNSPQEYVEKYHKIAIKKMEEYKIPASITLAQGILESGSGNSNLAQKANNHFGIKCHVGWEGKTFYMDDDEENECFRSYKNPEESFSDHSIFLTTRSRYDFLFTDYKITDYKGWAKGLKKAGYATNPAYADRLINIIDKYQLYLYDTMEYKDDFIADDDSEEDEMEFITKETKAYNIPKGVTILDADKGTYELNRIRTILAKERTPKQIASEYDLSIKKLYKYNDIFEGDEFEPHQNVFLQPKRRKGNKKTHKVNEGESMWDISQMYGVKVNRLRKINQVDSYEEPLAGQVINLRKKRSTAPKTMSYETFVKNKVNSEISKSKDEKIIEKKATKEVLEKTPPKTKVAEEKNKVDLFKGSAPKEETSKLEVVFESEEVEEIKQKINVTTEIEDVKEINENVNQKESVEVKDRRKVHKVAPGETLYAISRKYETTVENLVKWNNLPNFNINVGQELLVSPE